ncbi:dTDP-4-dehydrorhamnose 3,5-epimerase family protein [bacterium]|nr:dTDP-4-dehydrorhamnose 3,5-epimerase family protein [bacterium]
MKVHITPLVGVVSVESTPLRDSRGSFFRAFCDLELQEHLTAQPIRQINVSRTEQVGAVRGLHFQYPPAAEIKLVRCLRGRVWDVAVDLRSGSPTFLGWHAEELTPESNRMLLIPAGCAHGFQVLEAGSELLYLHTERYQPELEGGLRFDDPALGIGWPLPPCDLSVRDQGHPWIGPEFAGIDL